MVPLVEVVAHDQTPAHHGVVAQSRQNAAQHHIISYLMTSLHKHAQHRHRSGGVGVEQGRTHRNGRMSSSVRYHTSNTTISTCTPHIQTQLDPAPLTQ